MYAFVRPSAEYCGVFLRATKFDLEEKDAGTCHDFFGVPGCRPRCGRAEQVSNCESRKRRCGFHRIFTVAFERLG